MKEEHLNIEPVADDTDCDLCDLPTEGLPRALVQAMRRKGGVNACRECVERATEEANREKEEADDAT
jgi:hypothetical protein